jgi:hypothetical protein
MPARRQRLGRCCLQHTYECQRHDQYGLSITGCSPGSLESLGCTETGGVLRCRGPSPLTYLPCAASPSITELYVVHEIGSGRSLTMNRHVLKVPSLVIDSASLARFPLLTRLFDAHLCSSACLLLAHPAQCCHYVHQLTPRRSIVACSVTALPSDLLAGVPRLAHVNLAGNAVSDLPAGLVPPGSRLSTLYVIRLLAAACSL